MTQKEHGTYEEAYQQAQQAFALSLAGEMANALELLLQARTTLRRLSGDLALLDTTQREEMLPASFVTRTFAEARAWGWLELASGTYQLIHERSGKSMLHCSRAWRIWRPWSSNVLTSEEIEQQEARRERARAGLWLGESWARSMDERAEHIARSVMRAALTELAQLQDEHVLTETIAQQALLPPAPQGVPAYRGDGTQLPYVCTLLTTS
jgi:hypothetical protein